MGEIAPEATAAGFSFREVSNARAWSAPLENGARNIWRTEFSLAGVPAGRTHFKVCERRKTASGIYLWLSACTFWGRGKKELSYTACSYPDIGCVYTRKKNATVENRPAGHLAGGVRAAAGQREVGWGSTCLLGRYPRPLVPLKGLAATVSGQLRKRMIFFLEGLDMPKLKLCCWPGIDPRLLPKCPCLAKFPQVLSTPPKPNAWPSVFQPDS